MCRDCRLKIFGLSGGPQLQHIHDRARLQAAFSGAGRNQGLQGRTDLAMALFRAGDRLHGFADAPADEGLTDAQRSAWEAFAEGRAARLGEFTRKVRRQYVFRLYNGFTDVADDAFERLWTADRFTWAELDALCAECKAADPRPEPKQRSATRKETLRAQG